MAQSFLGPRGAPDLPDQAAPQAQNQISQLVGGLGPQDMRRFYRLMTARGGLSELLKRKSRFAESGLPERPAPTIGFGVEE